MTSRTALVAAILVLFLVGITTWVSAAPYAICDPYPLESSLTDADPPLPESFSVVFDNGTAISVPVSLTPDGRIYLNHDLGSVGRGKHVLKVKAVHSLWGESTEVPFTFRAGNPNPATGVSLQK